MARRQLTNNADETDIAGLLSRPFQPGKGVIAAQVHAFVETEGAAIAEVALSHLFKVYPELESVATACFEERGKDEPPHLLNVLERYGVITGRDRGRKMSGHMMKEGMRAYLAKRESIPVNGTPSGRMRFESVDEWAEELAALSASRNKLERRLRGIVLNFVRYDELHNPTRSLQDRLIKCVQPQRRSALQHLSADDLIEKLLWTELTALIEREWGLFQQIFADRQLFRQNATVINYRYDAHAKNVDRADVAEYRRALQWFEDKLAKV